MRAIHGSAIVPCASLISYSLTARRAACTVVDKRTVRRAFTQSVRDRPHSFLLRRLLSFTDCNCSLRRACEKRWNYPNVAKMTILDEPITNTHASIGAGSGPFPTKSYTGNHFRSHASRCPGIQAALIC